MNRIRKRMKSTNQSWQWTSGRGILEDSVCKQPDPQNVVVTFWVVIEAETD
jgi:hypothetical protein